MSINGSAFLLFLVVFAAAYYIAPKKLQWIVLLIASVCFYLSYSVAAALYLLITVLLTFGFSLRLDQMNRTFERATEGLTRQEKREEKKKASKRKKRVLALALILNFAALAVLKYSGFFVSNVNHAMAWIGAARQLPLPDFLLPLGISFYIFQTSGYLIDIYRGKYPPQRNLAKYALFVCYFPQMVQGPINRYDELESALFHGTDFHYENIRDGVLRMIWGVLKKAMVADLLAAPVSLLYSSYGDYPGVLVFFGAFLYCIQLYCDFSGGIDVVCGASALFGVTMRENFLRPYFAHSLADFWRRWHISLGKWMEDYLFYPLALSGTFAKLGKKARKTFRPDIAKRVSPCLATVIVFLVVGIWQGPGWSNIAYGLWNGVWMSLGMLWVPARQSLYTRFGWDPKSVWLRVIGVLRTNLLVIIGRYFSNSASLRGALGMLKQTVCHPGFHAVNAQLLSGIGLTLSVVVRVSLALIVLFFVSYAQERGVVVTQWLAKRKWPVQFAVLFVGLLLVVLFVYGNSDYVPIAYVYENV